MRSRRRAPRPAGCAARASPRAPTRSARAPRRCAAPRGTSARKSSPTSSQNRHTRSRPRRLAAYIARSAAASSVSAVVRVERRRGSDRDRERHLALVVGHRRGRDEHAHALARDAAARRACRLRASRRRAPRRRCARRCRPSGRQPASCRATSRSTASPAACPYVSFVRLKWSMSSSSSPRACPGRVASSAVLELLGEVAAVGETRQRIRAARQVRLGARLLGERERLLEPLLRALALRDVLHDAVDHEACRRHAGRSGACAPRPSGSRRRARPGGTRGRRPRGRGCAPRRAW